MDGLAIMKQQICDKIINNYKPGDYIYKDVTWLQKYNRKFRISVLEFLVTTEVLNRIYYYKCPKCNHIVGYSCYTDVLIEERSDVCEKCNHKMGIRQDYIRRKMKR